MHCDWAPGGDTFLTCTCSYRFPPCQSYPSLCLRVPHSSKAWGTNQRIEWVLLGERLWTPNVCQRFSFDISVNPGSNSARQAWLSSYLVDEKTNPEWLSNVTRLEKAMAPHSSTLAWKIPWTEEPGRLQSMRSLRVEHDWATSLWLFTSMHWRRKWQPTPVFLPEESQVRGSLVGCRLWDRTESDTTDVTQYIYIYIYICMYII